MQSSDISLLTLLGAIGVGAVWGWYCLPFLWYGRSKWLTGICVLLASAAVFALVWWQSGARALPWSIVGWLTALLIHAAWRQQLHRRASGI